MSKKLIAAAFATAAMITATSASAQVYVGASVGEATSNLDCASATNCSTNDTSYQLVGGYDITSNWAVEASYNDFGNVQATANGAPVLSIKSTSFGVAGLYKFDVAPQWDGFLKLGIASVKATNNVNIGSVVGSTSNTSAQPVAGVGVLYHCTDTVSVRAEFDTRKVESVSTSDGNYNITNFSIGLQASF